MKRILPLLLYLGCVSLTTAQPMQEGMGVVTYGYSIGPGSGNSFEDYSFQVYDFRDTYGDLTGYVNTVTRYHPMTADSMQWKRGYMGDVFGAAIDTTGNIYLAYSIIYQPGSFGPGVNGRGGIYRVNANDWSVTPITGTDSSATYNPAFDTILPNTYPGLGDICYDKWHNQLFVTNFEDGKIYRMTTSGHVLSTFDPFSPDDGIMGLSPYGERLWAVHCNLHPTQGLRLYFGKINEDGRNYSYIPATLNNEVWSVAIDMATGDFSGSEQFEVSTPETIYAGLSQPVTDIVMGYDGDLYLGTRPMDSLTSGAHNANDFKYTWQGTSWSLPQKFYLGDNSRDANGGIDLGFSMDSLGNIYDEAVLWSSANRLSVLSPPQLYVYGYTGMPSNGNSISASASNYYVAVDHVVPLVSGTGTWATKTAPGDVEIFRKYYYDNPKPVSVNEQAENRNDLRIFPNPASQSITVLWYSEITNAFVRVMDSNGKTVISQEANGDSFIQMDVSMLARGIYSVLVFSNNGCNSKVFIRE